MLTLYHLRISHYSEKARWALDYKRLPYRSRLLAPAFHILTVRRVSGGRTVPVLVDSEADAVVTDSTDVLLYLERLRPDPPLFPDDPEQAARISDLENDFDEVGRCVSGFFYHYLLEAPRALTARWTRGLRPHQRVAVRALMPLVPSLMRRSRGIDAESAERNRQATLAALDRVDRLVSEAGGGYLLGDRFSAADLTAACLLGPAVRPAGSPWGPDLDPRDADGFPPPPVVEFLETVASHPGAAWVRGMWERHRRT